MQHILVISTSVVLFPGKEVPEIKKRGLNVQEEASSQGESRLKSNLTDLLIERSRCGLLL